MPETIIKFVFVTFLFWFQKLEGLQKQNQALEEQAKLLRRACQQAREWLDQHKTCLYHTALALPSLGSSLTLPPRAVTSFPAHTQTVPVSCGPPMHSLTNTGVATLPRR